MKKPSIKRHIGLIIMVFVIFAIWAGLMTYAMVQFNEAIRSL